MRTSHLKPILLLLAISLAVVHSQSGYTVVDSYTDSAHSYYTASLNYAGNDTSYINATNSIIQNLNFTYFFTSAEHLVVRITDRQNQRWEVPHEAPFPYLNYSQKFAPYDNALVQVAVTESPFSFKITRKSTGEVIFDSSVGTLIYSDYYLQISTSLATPNIYGLGERATTLNLGPDGTYSIFNKDNPGAVENGTSGNSLYGYHPVYLNREQSNSFNMALLRSSVPMDVVIQGGNTLTYKVIGGIFDFQFFLGTNKTSDPETVMKQYHTYLGGWTLQPFWSFGFHQCRWGYHNVTELNWVLGNYSANHLPLDVMWSDIDYMNNFIDFTIDPVNFPPAQMNSMLAKYQKRWVPIIDAGVAINNNISQNGLNQNVFIKDANGTYLQGIVWPGETNYPDWYNPNSSAFWGAGLNELHQQVPFSGIWLDMNEASNFVPGETGFVDNLTNILNNPPYKPTYPTDEIFTKTMRMDAVHYGNISEYYLHNTFGFMEGRATYNYLKSVHDLVFILTRSSFYGSGQFVAHWTGDNVATYQFLALSIPGVMNSGFFGIPMAGSDICGFSDNTTPELCARWFQLGTLYPFSRDHNSNTSIPQEPYALGPTTLQTARVSLALRYSIVRHYYTQFLQQGGSGTIFRPVFFEFPTDQNLFAAGNTISDSQFLIGKSLMASPALTQGQTSVNVYFPQDTWFDFISGNLMQTWKQAPATVSYPSPLNATAPIFIRGGYIVPTQNVTGVNRTDDLSSLYQLNVAFRETNTAGVHTAEGALVGINNFADGNVLAKCKVGNCLYSVNANISVTNDSYNVSLSFSAQGDAANYESVGISSLFMMGDFGSSEVFSKMLHSKMFFKSNLKKSFKLEVVSSNVIKYVFEQPFAVENNALIQITGQFVEFTEVIKVASV